MSEGASLFGYRQGRERNLGSSYFWLFVFFFSFFFNGCFWFCGVFLVLFVFFFKCRGCGEGKPNNKKPLAFLQPACP